MFTHRYAGSQLARERNAKCWHKPASSTWCASSASTPRQAGAHSGRPADHPPAQAHPPSHAPLMTRTAAASRHPNWQDPSWPR
jgi:hypothetical protein